MKKSKKEKKEEKDADVKSKSSSSKSKSESTPTSPKVKRSQTHSPREWKENRKTIDEFPEDIIPRKRDSKNKGGEGEKNNGSAEKTEKELLESVSSNPKSPPKLRKFNTLKNIGRIFGRRPSSEDPESGDKSSHLSSAPATPIKDAKSDGEDVASMPTFPSRANRTPSFVHDLFGALPPLPSQEPPSDPGSPEVETASADKKDPPMPHSPPLHHRSKSALPITLRGSKPTPPPKPSHKRAPSIEESVHNNSLAGTPAVSLESMKSLSMRPNENRSLPPLPNRPPRPTLDQKGESGTFEEEYVESYHSPGESRSELNTLQLQDQLETQLENQKKSKDKEQKRLAHRMAIVNEIVSTEVSYIATLKSVVTCYVLPLRQEIKDNPKKYTFEGKPIGDEHLSQMFMNIEMIIGFNETLLEQLKQRQSQFSPETSCIGDVFVRLTPFLKLYTEYSNKYDASLDLLKKLTKSSRNFNDFLEAVRESGPGENLLPPLEAQLIGPIQRIPRYTLLLKDLLKNTTPDHPDYTSIEEAVALMEQTAEHVNNSMKISDNFQKLRTIQASFNRLPPNINLVEASRSFIKEGGLTQIKLKKKKQAYLFLLSDCILIGRTTILNKYNFKMHCPIVQTIPIDVPESLTSTFVFKLQTGGRTVTLQTQKNSEKLDWIQAINDARDKQMDLEGAKMVFKLMQKEEEKKILDKHVSHDSTSIVKSAEMERIMMESKKMSTIEAKRETIVSSTPT
eukprot:TRINITY_DN2676_c0_g1_i1.p1 TRINITY_DN2676_c0_g1~~TRINITY_DN2676_c0_g1_i1.p1  ORF type:complete len:736 (-),score=218.71 TRINITY_DN2676_c0_g1_i1:673-2880(-)